MNSVLDAFAYCGLHLQDTDSTCGPATLINALRIFGRDAPAEADVAEMCGCEPGTGTPNEAMAAAASQLGFSRAEAAVDASVDDLVACLDDGGLCVVNYRNPFSGNGHYAVVAAHDELSLFLWDPWLGLLRVPKADFGRPDRWVNHDGDVSGWFLAVWQ